MPQAVTNCQIMRQAAASGMGSADMGEIATIFRGIGNGDSVDS